ncbi:hypothetical protein UJ101_02393 [Flavobacteriaceae bacterium UJ101]|nr:hypothetical protein UJ101_02393 [Flavobacteriaceae bacterium UJ101]
MKGLIFVEFLEMVDEKFGMEITEEIVEKSHLPSNGYYTTIGTYDDSEMISLINELHKKTMIPLPKLLKTFGHYLFNRFTIRYASMLDQFSSGFELLKKIDTYIHVEVQKLYPQAILPHFDFEQLTEKELKLIYKSQRKMPDLAEGLIAAAMDHYNEKYLITKEIINEDLSWVNFIIKKQ